MCGSVQRIDDFASNRGERVLNAHAIPFGLTPGVHSTDCVVLAVQVREPEAHRLRWVEQHADVPRGVIERSLGGLLRGM